MKSCPFCAEQIQDAAVVCRFCNRDLIPRPSSVAPVATAPAPVRMSDSVRLFLLTIAGIGALFVVTFLVFGTQRGQPTRLGVIPSGSRNAAHAQLTAADEDLRRRVLTRMLDGERCGLVTKTFLQGFDDDSANAFWNAECSRGTSFVVMLTPDDKNNRILNCALAETLNLTPCLKELVKK